MFISLDLETTGLDKRTNRIIEIGATKFDLEGNMEEFQTFIDPGIPIPQFITHITGIKNEDVEGAPTLEEKTPELLEFIGDLPIVGHFISFDTSFLKAKGLKINNPEYDTAELSRIFVPGLPSYSLEILSEILKLEHVDKHRALDDSKAAQELFEKLIEEIKNLPEELFNNIKSICEKSTWKFAEIVKDLEQNKSKTPISVPAQSLPSPTKTSTQTSQIIQDSKTSLLIESPVIEEDLISSIIDQFKDSKDKTTLLIPHNIFREISHENKISLIENYISLERLEKFKETQSLTQPETTALIKILIWLEKTQNGLLTENLNLSPDEKDLLIHVQADIESLDIEKEPFVKKALELEKNTKFLIAEHNYTPSEDNKKLIIIDSKSFIHTLQSANGQTLSFQRSTKPIDHLLSFLKDEASQEDLKTLKEIKNSLEILFGILDTVLERNTSKHSFFPQPLEITQLETASPNWQKLKDITQGLISKSQKLSQIVDNRTLPYLRPWKETLKSLNILFSNNDEDSHTWLQKSRNEETVIRSIPNCLHPHFKKIKETSKSFYLTNKSLDAADNANLLRTILGISDKVEIEKIKPAKALLEKSQIFLVEDIPLGNKENLEETYKFVEEFLKKEKGKTVAIFNSLMKMEQAHMTIAPKLKPLGLTLLSQKGSGGLGKITELYKSSPETTSILLTPNIWDKAEIEDINTLIIHAIPFDPPSDQYLVALGKNFADPWNEFSLPTGILSLKKMINRFLSKKAGTVIILDGRISQKGYGSRFISSLSDLVTPCTITANALLK
ncbi:hypothetical protein HOG17_02435 [Candidatus Peregrinibacteria bacterium]|jgi:DNA polymerase III epsilon subunit-like protein/Rad3-related DNA helicase|nr:hypothetical protein [Candidatus Peregrinibacteria bacterium]MBT4147904.1 hypothetical protein [Candidatus Peregrinibacteria bacterium]MBT4365815.1 hypothetical protein [Candidatus Peregrinibacteria bacterium]MBT4456395.1 hypothetical protein [Candidatus Peregrinibacteria bacterium]